MNYTQNEVIDLVRKRENWLKSEIIHLLSQMKQTKGFQTNEIKVGDIVPSLGHPSIIIKITEEIVYTCLLTTDQSCKSILFKSSSRFFEKSYITSTVNTLSKTYTMENVIGVYDHKGDLQKLKEEIKIYYKTLLKI